MALDPSGLPQLDDGAAVRGGATDLQTAVGKVATRATAVQSTWSAIVPHYDAPEGGLVHTAMDTPVTAASTLVTKTGTAAEALTTYGHRLDELNAQRTQLAADMVSFNAHREKVTNETSGLLGWRDWSGVEKQDLLNKEEGLNDRAAEFAAAVDEAQRTCANAINAIFGGPQYKAADRASVDDPHVYGLSEDGYDQMGLSGKNAWGAPEGWTDVSWMSAGWMTVRGAGRSIAEVGTMAWGLSGLGEDGEAAAGWSGMWQLAKDAFYMGGLSMMLGLASKQQQAESAQRLVGVGKAILGIGTWRTSGWNTAGGFVPDIVLAVFTGGSAAAAKGGMRGVARGAVGSALTRLAPTTATRIGDLNTALRAGMRTRYNTALTGIRDLGYRGIDAFADIRRTTAEVPANVRQWADDLGRRLGPEPVPAGGPRPDHANSRAWEQPGMLQRNDKPSGSSASWPPHQPNGGHTPSSRAPGSTPYAGDEGGTGMKGAPPRTVDTTSVDVGHELMPRANEHFGQSVKLEANTRYEVRGRGVFYTGEEKAGKVSIEFVEPMRHSVGKVELMSPELRDPLPNVTYKVDDYAYYHTDRFGRTNHVHVEDLQRLPATRASRAANSAVVAGAADIDAGHLLPRVLGGAREEINLVQMVKDLNRGWRGRNLVNNNSVRHVEIAIEKALKDKGSDTIGFDLRINYNGERATRFKYGPTRNGDLIEGLAERTVFNK